MESWISPLRRLPPLTEHPIASRSLSQAKTSKAGGSLSPVEVARRLDQLESHSYDASQILHGFLSHLDPDGKRALVEDIQDCQDGNERLVALANHLLDAILKPFKLAGGMVPSPLTTPSSVDRVYGTGLALSAFEASTRDGQSSLCNDCLRRDGYRCVVTGAWDYPSCAEKRADPPDDARITYVDCAHILPFALGSFDDTDAVQTRNKSIIWSALQRYFPAISGKIDAGSINQPANAMILDAVCHRHFGEYLLTLEPQGNNEYRIESFNFPLKSKSGSSLLQFTSADDTVPMPDPGFLKVHHSIACILAVSGFGRRISEAAEKAYLDLDCHVLETSGSTDVGGLLSQMMLRDVRVESGDEAGEDNVSEITLRPGTG